jgi:hypothetical protein
MASTVSRGINSAGARVRKAVIPARAISLALSSPGTVRTALDHLLTKMD